MVKTSIIIPTYHRLESLLGLLESIQSQHEINIEVILVEQGDNNGDIIKKKCKLYLFPVHYFFQNSVSTSKAKNYGVSKSHGSYLIFYDDDVLLHKNAIKNIIKNFSDPKIGGVAGRVVDKGRKVESVYTNTGKISLFGSFTDGFSSMIKQDVDTVIGCNAAWRKDVFNHVGGFDEQFTGNAMREETDLSLRVKKEGFRIVFDPTASVTHLRTPTGGARKKDNRMYWFYHFFSNETYFYLKHRPAYLLPFFLFTRISYILRCMFGFGREVSIRSLGTPCIGILDGIKKYYVFLRTKNYKKT